MVAHSEAVARNVAEYARLSADEQVHYAMQLEKISRIARLLGSHARGPRLADVGSFTGWATERYAAATGARLITCFDVSDHALDLCARRGFNAVRWNGEEPCPSADGSFDAVVAADVIEHVVNTDAFLAELRRILRPGGILIVSTPNLAYWVNRMRLARGLTPWSYPGVSSSFRASETIDLNHIRINIPAEWTRFFVARGFRLAERTGYSIFHRTLITAWERLRSRIDLAVDDRAPDLAFGNIYVLERED